MFFNNRLFSGRELVRLSFSQLQHINESRFSTHALTLKKYVFDFAINEQEVNKKRLGLFGVFVVSHHAPNVSFRVFEVGHPADSHDSCLGSDDCSAVGLH